MNISIQQLNKQFLISSNRWKCANVWNGCRKKNLMAMINTAICTNPEPAKTTLNRLNLVLTCTVHTHTHTHNQLLPFNVIVIDCDGKSNYGSWKRNAFFSLFLSFFLSRWLVSLRKLKLCKSFIFYMVRVSRCVFSQQITFNLNAERDFDFDIDSSQSL